MSDMFDPTITNAKIKSLLETAVKKWKTEKGGILIIDAKDGFRYVTTKSPHMRIIKFERRRNTWKWVSIENIFSEITLSQDVKLDYVRKFCTNAARSFDHLIPV